MIAEISVKHKLGSNSFDFACEISHSITGIYGSSGAGKSTLLNILAGLENPHEGIIKIDNEIIFDSNKKINISATKRDIGYVFQEGRLFPHLSVRKNLCYSKVYVKNKVQKVSFDDLVNLLEIKPLLDKMPRQLSGGERQRVAIGRALLSQPALLLLDEPFSNLDRYLRRQIISYLLKINNRFSIPMLIVSHVIGDILRLTNQMIIVDKGKIAASGDIFDLMTKNTIPEIIKPRKYLNIYDAELQQTNIDEKLYSFSLLKSKNTIISTSSKISNELKDGTRIRFAVRPDDIALSKTKIENISIQNQLKGFVKKIISTEKSTFCVVDCGVDLIVEITEAALQKLDVKVNAEIHCLIKAKSLEIIHIFEM